MTKAEIEAEAIRLRDELASLRAEHEGLKVKVVDTARRYADDHGWCGVVEEALQEMGVVVQRRARVTVDIIDVEAFERMASELHGVGDVATAVVYLLDMDGDFAYEAKVEEVAA